MTSPRGAVAPGGPVYPAKVHLFGMVCGRAGQGSPSRKSEQHTAYAAVGQMREKWPAREVSRCCGPSFKAIGTQATEEPFSFQTMNRRGCDLPFPARFEWTYPAPQGLRGARCARYRYAAVLRENRRYSPSTRLAFRLSSSCVFSDSCHKCRRRLDT